MLSLKKLKARKEEVGKEEINFPISDSGLNSNTNMI
jgi:hypothetical protein